MHPSFSVKAEFSIEYEDQGQRRLRKDSFGFKLARPMDARMFMERPQEYLTKNWARQWWEERQDPQSGYLEASPELQRKWQNL